VWFGTAFTGRTEAMTTRQVAIQIEHVCFVLGADNEPILQEHHTVRVAGVHHRLDDRAVREIKQHQPPRGSATPDAAKGDKTATKINSDRPRKSIVHSPHPQRHP
jgi:hypothetical protein